MMDYGHPHQYNMYPEYCSPTPSYGQQYPPYSMMTLLTSGTGTTPTLTPTSLVSLEQTFTELQTASQRTEGAAPASGPGGVRGGSDPQTQSGFVPPIVDPVSRGELSQDSFGSSDGDADWEPTAKRARGTAPIAGDGSSAPQRKYTRRSRHEKLSPEEERRRAVRRERNKLAAAKCRQRRVDHTNSLLQETEKLEVEKSDLESEIQSLQQQREQLEFLLQAHVPVCKVDSQATLFNIKQEPQDFSLVTSCSSHHHPSSSSSSSRPQSLALTRSGELPTVVSCGDPGIAVSTPSSGLFTYTSLDSLVDGATGLTPLTSGLTPLTSGPVSCSSQVHRTETDSGSDVTSPSLISL